ncbi:ROK family protein [Robertmurraya massiliosenegalensis]|uniref:ROK family protein n=1 Tax=Robertmurraya TaxID=2837507 RepID=UPI0039A595BF
MNNYLVFDVGGSSVKYAVMNEQGDILTKGDYISSANNFDKFTKEIIKVTNIHKETYELKGIALSCPGGVNSESGVIGGASALPCIHGPNFKEVFGNATGLPIEIENDANCAALGEVWKGAARQNQDVLFIVIGSGIGGAVVKNRQIHHGANLHGGEVGYMVMKLENGQAYTWSDLASTRGLIENVAKRKSVLVEGYNGKRVFTEAENGDQDCLEAINEFYHYLAHGIYNLQYVYDPEKIIIGGAISSRTDLIKEIQTKLDEILDSVKIAKIRPVIEICHFKNDANLIGALYHFLQRQSTKVQKRKRLVHRRT